MEPNPVASSTQGTPPEPTASRPGSTADFNELLAKHASTVGNWASLVDEEAPVGESEAPPGVWMGASQPAGESLGQTPNNNQYVGHGPPKKFSRPGAFPQQQQGGFRGPQNQNDFRGVGRQPQQYGQYQQRDGGQRQRQQPQQQPRGKHFVPHQEANDVRAMQNRGDFGPPPVRPSPQISPPSDPREQSKPPPTVPAAAPAPQAKPRVNPFGAAKAVDTSKPFAQTEAKVLAERQASERDAKEKSAAHSHAASGATSPSSTEPNAPSSKRTAEVEAKVLADLQANEKEAKERAASGAPSRSSTEPPLPDNASPAPGNIRIMKREDRVSEDSGVPRNDAYAQQAKHPMQQQQHRPHMGHYPDMQSSSGAMPGQQMPQHMQSSPYMQRPPGQPPMQQQQQTYMGHYPDMQSASGSMSGHHQAPQHMQGSPHMQRPPGQPPMQQHPHMGHYPDMQSASGAMLGQQMPQHMQGSPHMQRPPGQPPGWPPNYPNAAYAPGFVVPFMSPHQQQQQQLQHQQAANQMAMQVHKEVLECERQLQMLYTQPPGRPDIAHQIACVQSHLHSLRSRLHASNQAQSLGHAAPPGMNRPPDQHLRMAPPQYVVPTVSPQAGAHMQPPHQMPIQRIPPPGMHQMSAEQQYAVAFMHPGANQVQVSIPPDMVGKIGINVYHHQQQYPSSNTGGSGSSITGMPMPADTPALTARDSVPPEPYPPSRSHEKSYAIPQTFGKPPNFAANKAPPSAVEPAYANAPTPKGAPQGADQTRGFTATTSATPPPSQTAPVQNVPSSAPTELTPKEELPTTVQASADTEDERVPSAEAKPSEESTVDDKKEEDSTAAPKPFPENKAQYSGPASRGKYARQSTYPQQQQQGSFRRAPMPQNNVRGVGRRQSAPFQQHREGPQHPKPQQQPRGKPYIPKPYPHAAHVQKEGGENAAPTRPSSQRTHPSPSTTPRGEANLERTTPPQSTSPASQTKSHPYGAAKAVDTTKRTTEIEAKVLAERQASEKEAKEKAAHSHAASGTTSPSSSVPPRLDSAPPAAGSSRMMKREKRVSEDSGVPRNESRRSLDGNLDVSRKTNSSSSVTHDHQRQFTRPSQPPQKYSGPAHTNTRDKKFVDKPQPIDSRRSTAERSDKSQTTRPPRPQQQPHPDGQRPRQQHGPPYGQKGGGRQAHEGRGGPRGAQKTDADNKPSDDRRPSVTKANEPGVKVPTDVAKEPDATPSNGKTEQPIQAVAEAKPSDHSMAPKKPLTFTNSSRKISHSLSAVTAPPTPAADAVKQLPNGQAQAAASSVEQPAAPKAETASSKKAAKKEKKACWAKAKESSITSKNKFGPLVNCDVYD